MKTIVFIGTLKSGSSREAIKAADKMGYFTVLLTDKPSHLRNRDEFPDVHYMSLCDLDNIDEIKTKIKQLGLLALEIVAIVGFIEPYCYTACRVADEFGVGRFTKDAVLKMQNKVLSREVLKDTIYAPQFLKISCLSEVNRDEIARMLPLIMKNPRSTGSKEVFLIKTLKDFLNVRTNLFKKYGDIPLIVEEFLDGPQYLVETLVKDSTVHIVTVISQEINFYNGHFIVTGYNVVINPNPEFYRDLKMAVEDIIALHGMSTGACHLEMRFVNNRWKLIEINPRISGGAMNILLEQSYGINLVEQTLKLIIDNEIDLTPKYKHYTFAEYVVSMVSGKLQSVTGRGAALRSSGVKVVYIKPRKGALITPPVSLGSRYAYVIASGENEEEARINAKVAAKKIKFNLISNPPWPF